MNRAAHEFCIHVGYPKTGTTTLRRQLFRNATRAHYWGKFGTRSAEGTSENVPWLDDLSDVVNNADDHHVAVAAPVLRDRIRDDVRKLTTERSIISLEGFTNPFVDQYSLQSKDIYRKAAHLHDVLGPLREDGINIRVLISLRRQTELLPSLFSQVCFHGAVGGHFPPSYDGFLDFLFNDTMIGHGPAFFYDRIVEHYRSLFGRKHVHVVEMERLFTSEIGEAAETLAAFTGTELEACHAAINSGKINVRKIGEGPGAKRRMQTRSPAITRLEQLSGRRRLNGMTFGIADRLRIAANRPVMWKLPDRSSRISEYYKASNARLVEVLSNAEQVTR